MIALAILGISPAVLCASKPYRIAGAVRDAKGKPHPAELLQESRKGVSFEIGCLDAAAARAAVRTALGRDLDLFPPKMDKERRGFMVFVLKLTNNAGEDLMFNPGHTRLATDGEDISFALDYSALYETTRRFGDAAPSLEELGEIIFDRGAVIRPGGSVRKLLVFDAPRDDRFREMNVRLLEIGLGAESFDILFPFRKFPVEGVSAGTR